MLPAYRPNFTIAHTTEKVLTGLPYLILLDASFLQQGLGFNPGWLHARYVVEEMVLEEVFLSSFFDFPS
jgi:hypothetical protein